MSEIEIPEDILDTRVKVVIIGSAKSVASAKAGHYYAHPSNQFWDLLLASGLTGGEFIPHTEDRSVLRHGVGLTDVVPGRAESNDSNLRPDDFDLPGLIAKMERLRPTVIAFNGGTSASVIAVTGECRSVRAAGPSPGPQPGDCRPRRAVTRRVDTKQRLPPGSSLASGHTDVSEMWVKSHPRSSLTNPYLAASEVR